MIWYEGQKNNSLVTFKKKIMSGLKLLQITVLVQFNMCVQRDDNYLALLL